jgi:hypothetical protein
MNARYWCPKLLPLLVACNFNSLCHLENIRVGVTITMADKKACYFRFDSRKESRRQALRLLLHYFLVVEKRVEKSKDLVPVVFGNIPSFEGLAARTTNQVRVPVHRSVLPKRFGCLGKGSLPGLTTTERHCFSRWKCGSELLKTWPSWPLPFRSRSQ